MNTTSKSISTTMLKIFLSITLVFLLVPAGAFTQVRTAFADSAQQSEVEGVGQNTTADDTQNQADDADNQRTNSSEASAKTDGYDASTAGESKITHKAEWTNKDDDGNIQAYDTANLNVKFDTIGDSSPQTGDGEFYVFFIEVGNAMMLDCRWNYMVNLIQETAKKVTARNPQARFGFQCYTWGAEKNSYDQSCESGKNGFWLASSSEVNDENFSWIFKKKVLDMHATYKKNAIVSMYIPCMVTFRSFLNWYIFHRMNKKNPVIHSVWITAGAKPAASTQTEDNIVKNMISSELIKFLNPAGSDWECDGVKRKVYGEMTLMQVMNGSELTDYIKPIINYNKIYSEQGYGYQFGKYKAVTDTSSNAISNDAESLARPINSTSIDDLSLTVNIDKSNFELDKTKKIEMSGFTSTVTETTTAYKITFTPNEGQTINAGSAYEANIPLRCLKASGSELDVVTQADSTKLTYEVNGTEKSVKPLKVDLDIPSNHKVTYDAKDGAGITLPDEATYAQNAIVTVANGSGLGKPITGTDRVGAFGGWLMTYTDATGTVVQKVVTEGSTFAMPNADVVLSALYNDVTAEKEGSDGKAEKYVLKNNTETAATGILEQALTSSTNSITADKITEISFTQNQAPSSYTEMYDISDTTEETGSCSIFMYVVEDTSASGYYKIQVDAPGTIQCNPYSLVSLCGGTYDISAGTYKGFTKCKNVNIENLDASSATSAYHMFSCCGKSYQSDSTVSTVFNFGEGLNTSNVTNMDSFFACTGSEGFDFSESTLKVDTSKAQNMSSFLRANTKATTAKVSSLNTQSATNMSYFFSRLSKLPNNGLAMAGGTFVTTNVTNMNSMFSHCTSIYSLNMKAFDTKKVTDMGYMFYNCSAMCYISFDDASNFVTSNVNDFGNMFDQCSKLVSTSASKDTLDLSNWGASNAQFYNAMFQACKALKGVKLPDGFIGTKCETIGYMFNQCSVITEIDLSGSSLNDADLTRAASLERTFSDCDALTTIYAKPKTDLSSKSSGTGYNMFSNDTKLKATKSGYASYSYDSGKINKTYAKAYNGSTLMGYFTEKGTASNSNAVSNAESNAEENSLDINDSNTYSSIDSGSSKSTNDVFSSIGNFFSSLFTSNEQENEEEKAVDDDDVSNTAYAQDTPSFDEDTSVSLTNETSNTNSAINTEKGFVRIGDIITYTITIKNNGDYGSLTNTVKVTDTVPVGMQITTDATTVSPKWIDSTKTPPGYASLSGGFNNVSVDKTKEAGIASFEVNNLAGQTEISLSFSVKVTKDAAGTGVYTMYYTNYASFSHNVVRGSNKTYYPTENGQSNDVVHYSGSAPQPTDKHTVTYINCGKTTSDPAPAGVPPAPGNQTHATGETVTLPTIPEGYTYYAPKFVKNDTEITSSFEMPDENVIVYICYTEKENPPTPATYTVKYAARGLDTTDDNPQVKDTECPSSPPIVGDTTVTEGGRVTIPSGLTQNNYNYLYDTLKSSTEKPESFKSSVKVELIDNSTTIPTTYTHSLSDEDLQNGSFTTPDATTTNYDTIKVTTAWERGSYTVKYEYFDPDDPEYGRWTPPIGQNPPDPEVVKWNDSFEMAGTQEYGTYTFEGWYPDTTLEKKSSTQQNLLNSAQNSANNTLMLASNSLSDANNDVVSNGEEYIMPTQDVTIYGLWYHQTDTNYYKVRVVNGTASINGETAVESSDSVLEGDSIHAYPTIPAGHKCTGITLKYLNSSLEAQGEITNTEFEPMQGPDGDWDLYMPSMTSGGTTYAGMQISFTVVPKTLNVTFDQNYDDKPESEVIGQTYGSTYTLPNPAPTREGYTFKGWYTDPDDNEGDLVDSTTTVATETDHTLYAHWTKNSYTLTIHYKYADTTKTQPAAPDYTATIEYDSSYGVGSPEISGYKPDQEKVSGTMPAKNVEETVTYTANQYDLVIHYRYEDGSEAKTDFKTSYAFGSTYKYTKDDFPTVTDAELKNPSQVIEGTMTTAGVEETVYYLKNTMTITATGYEDEYDGDAHSITPTVSGLPVGTSATLSYSTDNTTWVSESGKPTFTNFTDVAKKVYVKAECTNYKTVTTTATVNIKKRNITLTYSDDKDYDGNTLKYDFKTTDWKHGTSTTEAGIVKNETFTGTVETAGVDAHEYSTSSSATYKVNKTETKGGGYIDYNYNPTYDVKLTINKATITIGSVGAVAEKEQTYNGKALSASSDKDTRFTLSPQVAIDDGIVVTLTTNGKDVVSGGYNKLDNSQSPAANTFKSTINWNGKQDNYETPTADDFHVLLTINKAKISSDIDITQKYVSAEAVVKTYDQADTEISGIVYGEEASISYTTTSGAVGEYSTQTTPAGITVAVTPTPGTGFIEGNYTQDLKAKITITEEDLINVKFEAEPAGYGSVNISENNFVSGATYTAGKSGDTGTLTFKSDVVVKATPATGGTETYKFVNWTLKGETEPVESGTVTKALTFVAHFAMNDRADFEVAKSVTKIVDAAGNARADARIGDTIYYSVSVKNTGNITLDTIEVKDALLWGATSKTISNLAVGDTHTFTEDETKYVVKQSDFESFTTGKKLTNTAIATYDGTDKSASASSTLVLTPIDAPKAVKSPEGKNLTYNGSVQTGVSPYAEGKYTLSGETGTDVSDKYSATAKLSDGYIWSDNTLNDKQIPWAIDKAPLTVNVSDSTEYDKDTSTFSHSVKAAEVTGLVGGETIVTGADKSEFHTASGDVKRNSDNTVVAYTYAEGDAEGFITLADSKSLDNYAATYNVSLTITPKDISEPDPPQPTPPEPDIKVIFTDNGPHYEYSDTEYQPAYQVKDKDGVMVADTDYLVDSTSQLSATIVGDYKIKISGIGNYTGNRTINWDIYKRKVTVTPTKATHTYDKNPHTLIADEDNLSFDRLCSDHSVNYTNIQFDKTRTEVGTTTGVSPVDTSIKISKNGVADYEKYYEFTCKTADVEITKASININVYGNIDQANFDRSEHSVSGYTLEPAADADKKLYNEESVRGPAQEESIAKGTNVKRDSNGDPIFYTMGLTEDDFMYIDNNVEAVFTVKNDGGIMINPLSLAGSYISLAEVARVTDPPTDVKQNIDYVKVGDIDVYTSDYTVSGDIEKYAGEYTLKITATKDAAGHWNGNFVDSNDKPWVLLGSETPDPETQGEVDFTFTSHDGAPVSTLNETKCDMIENTVTANELSDVCRGNKVYVYMNVKDGTSLITEESKALFEAEMAKNSQKLGQYVDISIAKIKNTELPSALHETLNPASITMEIPESLLPEEGTDRSFYILRNHDGEISDLGATYDKENQTLTFSSDKYSDYAIVYSDGEEPDPPGPTPDPPTPTPTPTPTPVDDNTATGASVFGSSTTTGDMIALGVLSGVLAVVVAAAFIATRTKRKNN